MKKLLLFLLVSISLQSAAQLRIMMGHAPNYNATFSAYLARVGTHGGYIPPVQRPAWNAYCKCIADSLVIDSIVAEYEVLNNSGMAVTNLKNDSFVMTIGGSPTINNTGWTSNAASYGATGVPMSRFPSNNIAMGFYQPSPSSLSNNVMGIVQSTGKEAKLLATLGTTRWECYSANSASWVSVSLSSGGGVMASRISSTDTRLFINGVQVGSNNSVTGTIPDAATDIAVDGVCTAVGTYTPQGATRRFTRFTVAYNVSPRWVRAHYNCYAALRAKLNL